MGFFEELKRRNVFRVGIAYLVVGWVLAQVAEYSTETFGAPDWVLKTFTVFLLLGFPLALIFAWVFERTPEGIKLEKNVDRSQSITTQTGRKLDFFVIGLLAIAVVYLGVDKFFLSQKAPETEVVAQAPSNLSIAVLPFTNMSADAANEFFCDGLSEELLNVLAKIEGMKVAGRTSSFHFKGKNEDLRLIGNQLGVEHILEGSVRKSGNSVRITAQLIKAEDGFHLWSETYDRQLDDIFAIQDEIAGAVASALRGKLLGEDQSVAKAQTNIDPEVYARFIAARSRIAARGRDNLVAAHESLEQIVQEAPDYGPAHAALAIAAVMRARTTDTLATEDARAIARQAMERALALSPNDDYVRTANGAYLSELVENASDAGLRRVNQEFRRALELNPENVEAMYFLAFNLRYLEEYEETVQLLEDALRIDPLDFATRDLMVWALTESGRIDQAIELAQQSLELFPGRQAFYRRAAQAEMTRGRGDRALAWLYQLQRDTGGGGLRAYGQRLFISNALGYEQGVNDALEALGKSEAGRIYAELFALQERGQFEKALTLVKEAIARQGWAAWEFELFFIAVLAGHCKDAYESNFASRLLREWSEDDPRVDATNDNRAAWTAYCMRRQGDDEQAEKLLRALLAYAAPRGGRFDEPVLRSRRLVALAMLGERDRFIEEFQAYYDAGFGSLPLVSYRQDPRFASVVDDPEFLEVLAAIEARNSRRLDRLIANDFSVNAAL